MKPKDEISSLNDKSTKVTVESAAKTREFLGLINECKDAGVITLQNLFSQGEQLNRSEAALDDTETNLDKATIRLQNIERSSKCPTCCLPCLDCFQKDPDISFPKKGNASKTNTEQQDPEESNITAFSDSSSVTVLNMNKGRGGIEAYNSFKIKENLPEKIGTTDAEKRFFAKIQGTSEEEEIERNLGHVSNHLSHLKTIATDVNVETQRQNEQLSQINLKAERNLTKLDKVTKTTTKLVKDGNTSSSHKCCNCCCIL